MAAGMQWSAVWDDTLADQGGDPVRVELVTFLDWFATSGPGTAF
jgi:hypothetical protein